MRQSHLTITNPRAWSHHTCPLDKHRLVLEDWPVVITKVSTTDPNPNRARATGLTVLVCSASGRLEHHSWIWNPGYAARTHEMFKHGFPELLTNAPRFEDECEEVSGVINMPAKVGYKHLKSELWVLHRELARAGAGLVANNALVCDIAETIENPPDLKTQYERSVGSIPADINTKLPIRQVTMLLRIIKAGMAAGFRLPIDCWTAAPPLFPATYQATEARA